MLSSRAGRGQKTHSESCPQWRPDSATSAKLTRSRRPTGTATGASCLPCRHVAAFQDRGAHPPPFSRPRAPVKWPAVSRKATSEALPRDRPRCRLCSGPGIRWIPKPFQQSPLRRGIQILPRRPRSGLLPQSRRRDLSTEDLCAKAKRPRSSPSEEPQAECSRILPPVAPNAALSSTPTPQQLNACPIRCPGCSATKGTAGHTRGRASPSARQSGCPVTLCRDNQAVWTAPRRTRILRELPPACRPPKGKPAVRVGCVLASCGSSGFHCGLLV